jgi:hypothetical protein
MRVLQIRGVLFWLRGCRPFRSCRLSSLGGAEYFKVCLCGCAQGRWFGSMHSLTDDRASLNLNCSLRRYCDHIETVLFYLNLPLYTWAFVCRICYMYSRRHESNIIVILVVLGFVPLPIFSSTLPLRSAIRPHIHLL